MSTIKTFITGLRDGFGNFSHTLMNIVNFILLSLVYFTAIALVSIISKLLGKKFLDLRLNKVKSSYWLNKPITTKPLESYYKQF